MDRKSFLAQSVVFLVSLWLGAYLLAAILDNTFRQDRSNKHFWILAQRGLSVDYAVAGSSRALNNIDVETFEKHIGGKALNIAVGGQSIMDMYLTVYLFLSHQNQFRHLVLQIDGTDLEYGHKALTHLYPAYMSDYEVAATLRDLNGLKRYYVMRVFPLAKYWEYNSFYTLKFLQEARSDDTKYDRSAGSELLFDDTYQVFQVIEREPEFRVDARSRRYLDRLVEAVKMRGIKVTIFSAPMYHRTAIFNKYDQASRAYLVRYCQERSIRYFDFTNADFERFEFRDYGHLNGRGALRFTAVLADELLKDESTRE